MDLFVETLKLLYQNKRDEVTEVEIDRLLRDGKIDEKEKNYILGKEE